MSPRRFDYMEKQVWQHLRKEIESHKGDFTYVVVGSEPSTDYLWIDKDAFHNDLGKAKKRAGQLVDEATKTSGWVFMPIWNNEDGSALPTGVELECLGYAYWGGDGDVYFHWEDDLSGSANGPNQPSDDKVTP